jgi:ribonuclease HI
MEKVIIHTDGGSRGNPGPSAIGVVVEGLGEKKEYAEFLGHKTNNDAEYEAVIFALKKVKGLVGSDKCKMLEVKFYLDSELVVKQLNGEYKVKELNIQDYFIQIWNLRMDFGKTTFNHIPREKNAEADRLVNIKLDEDGSRLQI